MVRTDEALTRWLVVGFVAGRLPFHQAGIALLHQLGVLPRGPYSMAPTAPWGVPQIASTTFWGGLLRSASCAHAGGVVRRGTAEGWSADRRRRRTGAHGRWPLRQWPMGTRHRHRPRALRARGGAAVWQVNRLRTRRPASCASQYPRRGRHLKPQRPQALLRAAARGRQGLPA